MNISNFLGIVHAARVRHRHTASSCVNSFRLMGARMCVNENVSEFLNVRRSASNRETLYRVQNP